jgi:DNA mismatch repair protein MutS
VERKVVRVVTPGTVTDQRAAGRAAPTRSLLAVHRPRQRRARAWGLAWLDVASGELRPGRTAPSATCRRWLARLAAGRDAAARTAAACAARRARGRHARRATARPGLAVRRDLGRRKLCAAARRAPRWPASAPTSCPLAQAAAAALLRYAEHTQGQALAHVQAPGGASAATSCSTCDAGHPAQPGAHRRPCAASTRPRCSSLLDTCRTGMGSRAAAPLAARIPPRCTAHRAGSATQRDAPTLADGAASSRCARRLRATSRRRAHRRPHRAAPGAPARAGRRCAQRCAPLPRARWRRARAAPLLQRAVQRACATDAAGAARHAALPPSPRSRPRSLRDGGVIAAGLRRRARRAARPSTRNCDDFLLDLEARERERTGIRQPARCSSTSVHGFYIEVTQRQA